MPTAPDTLQLLVVDDDDGIRTLLEVTASLDPRFDLVAMAGCGSDAVEALRSCSHDLDVVLLDVTLPDRDGIELVRDLRTIAPTVRIALFTGWSDDETLARARDAGADAVFGKDGDPQLLLDRLAALCAGREPA